MAKYNITIENIEETLEHFKQLKINNMFPKSLTMKAVTSVLGEISRNDTSEKKIKKEKKKPTAYNVFFGKNMNTIIKENPEMTHKERMGIMTEKWNEFKEENPNYKELLLGSDDDKNTDNSDDDVTVAKKNDNSDDDAPVAKKNEKKKVGKKTAKKKETKKKNSEDEEEE